MSSVCSVLVHGFEVKLNLNWELLVLGRLYKRPDFLWLTATGYRAIPQDLARPDTLLQFQGLNCELSLGGAEPRHRFLIGKLTLITVRLTTIMTSRWQSSDKTKQAGFPRCTLIASSANFSHSDNCKAFRRE